ncbi:MAG: RlmE family RNA methyltransferase [Candidatus Alcyoniella australis]|nr:RlmE family RNA methyltransferase [Candidatus Alcyoniella australis]
MGRRRQDHWAKRAKTEHYRARSAYKLMQIDDKYKLLRPQMRVLDLGCAPGSWLQVAAQRVGPQGLVIGLDLNPVEPVAINVVTITADALGDLKEIESIERLPERFDIVLSDMAPNTSGIKDADHYRSMELAQVALDQAWRRGAVGSSLVIKIFQGPDIQQFIKQVKSRYKRVSALRPETTRKVSREIFIIGRERRSETIAVG